MKNYPRSTRILFTALALALVLCLTLPAGAYVCGDIDDSGAGPDIADLVYLVAYMFSGGPQPAEMESANVDGLGGTLPDIADLVYLVAYMFQGGPALVCTTGVEPPPLTYPIVDTDQEKCFNTSSEITPPTPGAAYYGQDAQYDGNQMSYTDNGDSTITDNVTGLMWTKACDWDGDGDIDYDDKFVFTDAENYPATLNAANFAGYNDWRLPSIKEIYSLMNFSGTDPSGPDPSGAIPFIDTSYFDFAYGDEASGERLIDAQFWTTAVYTGFVFGNRTADFGLNLADGRIKGYPTDGPNYKYNYVYFVRGNIEYGINDFYDNCDGTITDSATGLMWSQDDFGDGVSSGPRSGMTWVEALAFVETKNSENYLGFNDWRMPNAKELQSIVDYDRSPDYTTSAAIDSVFDVTQITNEMGQVDYPWYWSNTTHISSDGQGRNAVYVCFGRGTGYMMGSWLDVHGAGCQRSDAKAGNFSGYTYISDGYYFGMAPQGDASRQYNYVRLVRDAE